jgi:hypothetical protein
MQTCYAVHETPITKSARNEEGKGGPKKIGRLTPPYHADQLSKVSPLSDSWLQ